MTAEDVTAEQKIYRLLSLHTDDPVSVEELIADFRMEVRADTAQHLDDLMTRLGPGHFGDEGMAMAAEILKGATTWDDCE